MIFCTGFIFVYWISRWFSGNLFLLLPAKSNLWCYFCNVSINFFKKQFRLSIKTLSKLAFKCWTSFSADFRPIQDMACRISEASPPQCCWVGAHPSARALVRAAGLALVAADLQESEGIVYSLVSVLCFKGFVSEISSLVKWTEGTIFSINHYLSAPKHLSFNPHFFKLEESRNNSIIDQDFHKEFCISPCCKEDLKFLAN